MSDKLDFAIVKALLKKQWQEGISTFKKSSKDVLGFVLRIVLVAALVAAFVYFYSKFSVVYLSIKSGGVQDSAARLNELLTITYSVILLFTTLTGVAQITKMLFNDEEKVFSAMPVSATSLFVAKVIRLSISQFFITLVTFLPVNIVAGVVSGSGTSFYLLTVLFCFLFPLISIALASILALPYRAIVQFLKPRSVLSFVVITLLSVGLIWIYFYILSAVKEMLFGDQLKYFFNQSVMQGIASLCSALYPGKWFADFVQSKNMIVSGVCILAVIVGCLVIALITIKKILVWAMQSKIAGSEKFVGRKKPMAKQKNTFFALIKKDFLLIFRTPTYAFSYFSVTVLMPLMVYFCISIGASLLTNLLGINCNTQLAVFLTLIFGVLTNLFCATNISREGEMFYSLKAMPIDGKSIFFSKVALCMAVSCVSLLASSIILCATGYISVLTALFVFAVGLLFSFAQICFATRFDFNHCKFSTETDGQISDGGNATSIIILLGLAISFAIGGTTLFIKLSSMLRGNGTGELFTYVFVGVIAVALAAASLFYLLRGLRKKYQEFSGGGLV